MKKNFRKVVFIDRDGVINLDLGGYVTKWEDFEFLPGVLDGLRLIRERGYDTVVISNQAGVGDGLFSKETLDHITASMTEEVREAGGEIRAVYYCLHGKKGDCDCRKPKTGLFEQAHRQIDFNPAETFFVGDKISDIKAGKDYGLKTIMVLTGYGAAHQAEITPETKPDYIARDFKEAVDLLLVHDAK